MSRKANDPVTSVCLLSKIKAGVAEITLPQSLKKRIFQTFAVFHSVHSLNNFGTVYYLTSNACYHTEHDQRHKQNIMQMFKAKNEIEYFGGSKLILTLNQTPDTLLIFAKIIDEEGYLKIDPTFEANLCIELYGFQA